MSGGLARLDTSPRSVARRGLVALVAAGGVELAIVAVANAADWPAGAFYAVSALALAIMVAVAAPIIEPPRTPPPKSSRTINQRTREEVETLTAEVVGKQEEQHQRAARDAPDPEPGRSAAAETRTLSVGESLVGEGNEVAHIDVMIGSKSGPVGKSFARSLVNQKEGHTNLLAVVAPNLPAKPDTIIANKVTIKGATQAVQMFGPAQAAVARAVVDSVSEGVIPQAQVDNLCLVVGVFIHWAATDDKKIFDWNYQATKEAIARAMAVEPPFTKEAIAGAMAVEPALAKRADNRTVNYGLAGGRLDATKQIERARKTVWGSINRGGRPIEQEVAAGHSAVYAGR